MEEMNLLVTLDQNYLPPLQVLLTSLHVNQPQEPVALYLLHSGIPAAPLEQVGRQCGAFGIRFCPVRISKEQPPKQPR